MNMWMRCLLQAQHRMQDKHCTPGHIPSYEHLQHLFAKSLKEWMQRKNMRQKTCHQQKGTEMRCTANSDSCTIFVQMKVYIHSRH
mmetsp:Transcript_7171/g.26874  ORF Transcript_7171/g.26874 Transcript_7171/m.26874 type:complete len:85 (-) Transcript_7171:762-1016(-)